MTGLLKKIRHLPGRGAFGPALRTLFISCLIGLQACVGSDSHADAGTAPLPDGVSIIGDGEARRLVVRPQTSWGSTQAPEVVALQLTGDKVFISASVWGRSGEEPTTARFTLDSGAYFGASLSRRTADRMHPWIPPRDLGLGKRRIWSVVENPAITEGALLAMRVGAWNQSPVQAIVRAPHANPNTNVLGIEWMKESGAMFFDWEHSRLMIFPPGLDEPPLWPKAWWESPSGGNWSRVPFAPKIVREYSPQFTQKEEALRWLREHEDPHPEKSLASVPDYSDRPFKVFADSLLTDSAPCVEIELGGQKRVALVDLGYSGDIGWFGAMPPKGGLTPDPPERIEFRAADATGTLDRRHLITPVRIGGVEFRGLSIDSAVGSVVDPTRFGWSATLGLGVLRRHPFVLDFQRQCVWFWFADSDE